MIKMNEMTWMEFDKKIKEGAITILPIGAGEQHAPLNVDTVLANGFAERLATKVGGMSTINKLWLSFKTIIWRWSFVSGYNRFIW